MSTIESQPPSDYPYDGFGKIGGYGGQLSDIGKSFEEWLNKDVPETPEEAARHFIINELKPYPAVLQVHLDQRTTLEQKWPQLKPVQPFSLN